MPRSAPPALLATLLVTLLLAGCASPLTESSSSLSPASLAPTAPRPMDWSPGSWWSYHATIGNETIDLALIVHERRADGFLLGTNLSVGFFGLPFSGNVTPSFNPRIGTEVWPLFAFPLADGKSWDYSLFGYNARTRATDAVVDVAGLGPRPGYHLESTSFGQVFARYDYAPDAAWFTRLELIEPTDGSTVLLAELTAYGHDWDAAYYVEETVREIRIDYPTLPGAIDVRVPDGYLQARATLTAQTGAGAVSARLEDEAGRPLARVEAVARGADVDRASARTDGGATWTFDHRGVGLGFVVLQVTGVSATGPLAPPAPSAFEVDLARIMSVLE